MKLIFLGTGGGRDMMIAQVRKTGGLFFDMGKTKFIVDPGPGALVHAVNLGLRPDTWKGLLLSHFHIDHSADANALLDGLKDPFLVAEEHCFPDYKGKEKGIFRCIAPYHVEKSKSYSVKPGDKVKINQIEFQAIKADHYDPVVGFRISGEGFDVGYTSDGAYYKGMEKYYDGCKILIINVVIPKGGEAKRSGYMSVDGIITLLRAMEKKPQLVILTHFSFWFMRSNLWKQEKIIQDATKVKTIHAEDFMALDLETLAITKYKEKLK